MNLALAQVGLKRYYPQECDHNSQEVSLKNNYQSSSIIRLRRLVAILTLLQTKRIITANELATWFEVSVRTIYRDVRLLEQAGIPIFWSKRGLHSPALQPGETPVTSEVSSSSIGTWPLSLLMTTALLSIKETSLKIFYLLISDALTTQREVSLKAEWSALRRPR